MANVYVGDIGTQVIIDMQEDISSATGVVINVKKPDGSTDTWTPAVYNTNFFRYVITSGDLNIRGTYTLQVNLTLGSWSGSSTPCQFSVRALI